MSTTNPNPPLANCCFIIRGKDGATVRQGYIWAVFTTNSSTGDMALVQYFEAFLGESNTMALVPVFDMRRESVDQFGGWVLFEDDKHLRDYYERYQRRRDQSAGKSDKATF